MADHEIGIQPGLHDLQVGFQSPAFPGRSHVIIPDVVLHKEFGVDECIPRADPVQDVPVIDVQREAALDPF